jgi:hypothetical protein
MVAVALVAAFALAAAQAAPPSAPASPAPAAPSAPESARKATSASSVRQAAEEAQLRQLVPAPLTSADIRALATRLGAAPDAAETVQALIDRYRERTREEFDRATAAVRPRLTSAYSSSPTGVLEASAGPELVAVLERSQAWRALLSEADGELLRTMINVRTETANATPAQLGFLRAVDRDDMPSMDPAAGIRLPALLDTAALAPADRRRLEDTLERQWSRGAAAIAARRRARDAVELQRARLMEQWGPAWELTATPALMQSRQRQLTELDARARAAEDDLRATNREAVVQLLRLLPQEHAARVRDAVDAIMWPSMFVHEELLKQAVVRAGQGADPALLSSMQAVLAELHRKLEATRRDLSRKASRAEELDSVLASVDLGASPQSASDALVAQLDLMDTLDRRRKILRDAAVQVHHMAHASGAPNAPFLEERVTALDADARASRWLRQGLQERIDQLGLGGRDRLDESAPESETGTDTPATASPGTSP